MDGVPEPPSKFRNQHFGAFEKSLRGSSVVGKCQTQAPRVEDEGKPDETAVSSIAEESTNEISRGKRNVFCSYQIKGIMDEILKENLSARIYDANSCRLLCGSLSDEIKSRVKKLGMKRFRLICFVSIGSNFGQGFFYGQSICLE